MRGPLLSRGSGRRGRGRRQLLLLLRALLLLLRALLLLLQNLADDGRVVGGKGVARSAAGRGSTSDPLSRAAWRSLTALDQAELSYEAQARTTMRRPAAQTALRGLAPCTSQHPHPSMLRHSLPQGAQHDRGVSADFREQPHIGQVVLRAGVVQVGCHRCNLHSAATVGRGVVRDHGHVRRGNEDWGPKCPAAGRGRQGGATAGASAGRMQLQQHKHRLHSCGLRRAAFGKRMTG